MGRRGGLSAKQQQEGGNEGVATHCLLYKLFRAEKTSWITCGVQGEMKILGPCSSIIRNFMTETAECYSKHRCRHSWAPALLRLMKPFPEGSACSGGERGSMESLSHQFPGLFDFWSRRKLEQWVGLQVQRKWRASSREATDSSSAASPGLLSAESQSQEKFSCYKGSEKSLRIHCFFLGGRPVKEWSYNLTLPCYLNSNWVP